jgi:hypothetical protein
MDLPDELATVSEERLNAGIRECLLTDLSEENDPAACPWCQSALTKVESVKTHFATEKDANRWIGRALKGADITTDTFTPRLRD